MLDSWVWVAGVSGFWLCFLGLSCCVFWVWVWVCCVFLSLVLVYQNLNVQNLICEEIQGYVCSFSTDHIIML